MQLLLLPLAFVAGGLARRVAGGVLNDWIGWEAPGTLAKLFYAGTLGGISLLAGAAWWFALVLAANVFVGHVIHGLWDAGGMGHLPPDNLVFSWRRFVRDWFALWGYGLGHVVLSALLAVWIAHPWWASWGPIWDASREHSYHWLPLVLGGLSSSPTYTLTWALSDRNAVPLIRGVTWDGRSALPSPLQFGEWIFGGCLGVGALLCVH